MAIGRACLLWAAVSLAVRLLVLLALGPMAPLYDEGGYVSRGRGFEAIYGHLLAFSAPPDSALDAAYGRGTWPPLHPMLLGMAFSLFGSSLAVARLLGTLLSSATTPVVFLVTRRIASLRAAHAAALLHVVYPSFVAFSHLLWSESVYILCLLLALLLVLVTLDTRSARLKTLLSAAAGAALGLSALTRAAALPLLFVLPLGLLWFDLKSPRATLRAGLVFATALLVLSPWLVALRRQEGHFVPISTAAGYNLVLGNNPWPGARGRELRRNIGRVASEQGITRTQAERASAAGEIRRHPGAFVGRSVVRFRRLWASDEFAKRHLLSAIYPPLPAWMVWALLVVLISSLGMFLTFALAGLTAIRIHRKGLLLVLLVAASCVPPVLTVSNTRMGLPLLALLLPIAGQGVFILSRTSVRQRMVLLALLASLLASAVTLPRYTSLSPVASGFYRHTVGALDALTGARTPIADCLRARTSERSQPIEITLSPGYAFAGDGGKVRTFPPRDRPYRIKVTASSDRESADAEPLELAIRSPDGHDLDSIQPIRREYWHRWQSTQVEGFELMWCGAGR